MYWTKGNWMWNRGNFIVSNRKTNGVENLKQALRKCIEEEIQAIALTLQVEEKHIKTAYLTGATRMFNEMFQVSTKLPEHMAEATLVIFVEVLKELKKE